MTAKGHEDKVLRKQLVELLEGGGAHANFETAVKDLPSTLRGTRPTEGVHSPWELLEHLRIAQRDILEFTRDPEHKSPEFPQGYWPASPRPENDAAWERSADAFRADLKAVIELAKDESLDLFSPLSHGDGQTPFREILLVADHNSYHLGEMVVVRRMLGAWSK